jgi:ribose/xylose/arabinose/galactoside ABC-type transport system permease subunit
MKLSNPKTGYMTLMVLKNIQVLLLPTLLVFAIALFSALSPFFLTASNLTNIAVNSVDLALVAAGLTLILLMGGIDVSTGFAVGLIAWFVGTLSGLSLNPYLILVAAIALGSVIGLFNGSLTIFFGIPSIVATIGTAAIYQTLLFVLWNSRDVFADPLTPFLSGSGSWLGVPTLNWLVLFLYLVLHLVLTKTSFGRSIFAIGSNPEAANLIGLKIRRTRLIVYAILGGLLGLAAVTYLGRVGVVQAYSGNELTFMAIASVVVGGTSILGGEGSILRTLGGVAFIMILNNGIVLAGVPSIWNGVVIGSIILFAVSIKGAVVILERKRAAI